MASYVDLVIKTNKSIKFYDVNDPFLDILLLHPDFFNIDTAEQYIFKTLKENDWKPTKKLSNYTFEKRICLIDFTKKTITNAKIFPINEFFTLGIFLRMQDDLEFASHIETLFNQGHLNTYKKRKKDKTIIKKIYFKNFKDYKRNLKKSFQFNLVSFGNWKYKQVRSTETILKQVK